jgi:hypothetical protein
MAVVKTFSFQWVKISLSSESEILFLLLPDYYYWVFVY